MPTPTDSFPDWLEDRAMSSPQALALIYETQSWTYRQLADITAHWAGWLIQQGIRAGYSVGVCLPNVPEYVFTVHALMRLGAVAVLLNTRLTADELAYQISAAECVAVISSAEYARAIQSKGVRVIDTASYPSEGVTPAPPRKIHLPDVQSVLFTSGTSGKPKGAQLTYGNHFYSATSSAFRIGVLPADRWLCVLPLYHVGGLAILMRSVLYGTCVILQNGFDVEAVNHALDHQRVTLASLVPTMLYRLLNTRQDAPAPASLRLILLGGAAADQALVQRSQAAGFPVVTTYGLTEACSQVATQTIEGAQRKPASVGKPIPFVQIQIVDDHGVPQPPGTHGEIVIRSKTTMRGYLNGETANAQVLRDGALYTGDIGYMDEDGDLWLVQRRSDLIISGGENIYPAEVEAALKAHPAVEAVCVVGVPHPEWGQMIAAVIVLKDEDVKAEALQAFCRERLAGYKIPRVLRFVQALPLTASGKIERKAAIALVADA